MARRKYHTPETRDWDWQAPAPLPPIDDSPVRIDDVDGVEIEIRRRPGMGLVMRPPSYTTRGPDGTFQTERVVAAAWYGSHYLPWQRRQHGHTAPALPVPNTLDGLLSDAAVDEEGS